MSKLVLHTIGTSDIDLRAGLDADSSWGSSSLFRTGIELARIRWRNSASLA